MPSIAGRAARRNLDDVAIFVDEQAIPLEYIEIMLSKQRGIAEMAGEGLRVGYTSTIFIVSPKNICE
jgi:hypothetical protein